MKRRVPPTRPERAKTEHEKLPEPEVAASFYDQHYFRSLCAGSGVWTRSGGADAAPRYLEALRKARLREGEVVVDIGTGRGELLTVAVDQGAARAIGVEYSLDAVDLARQTIERRGAGKRAQAIYADARATPLKDGFADLVTMLDVVEHLAAAELDATLQEALRILKPGGRVMIHTAPNRLVYDVTYRLLRALNPRARRMLPEDPRHPFERATHVNEQTPASLRRVLKRNRFERVRVQLGSRAVRRVRKRGRMRHLARIPIVRLLVVIDIWGRGRKPVQPP